MNKIPEAQSVGANQKKKKRIYLLLYIAAITIIFIISFSYIFNKKVDLNGDYFSFPLMKSLHKLNKEAYPPNYMNFFIIAQTVKKELPHDVIVCSRKPSLFYMYGGTYSCPYKWTNDDAELIKGLVDSNVDYVVLDQLGFSSTYRYLYPAIEKNPELFSPVYYLPDPDTYLLQFHRDKAILQLGGSE